MSSSAVVVSPSKPNFSPSLRNLLKDISAGDARPFIFNAVFGVGNIRDGETVTDAVDQRTWEALYGQLVADESMSQALPPLPGLFEKAARGDAVTIALVNLHYQKPGRALAQAIMRAEREDKPIERPAAKKLHDLLEERIAFFACAILPPRHWGFERAPDIHTGLHVKFRIASDLCVSDGPRPDRLAVDFDDGNGFCKLPIDQDHEVDYQAAGDYRVVLRAHFGSETRIAAFQFRVADKQRSDDATHVATLPILGWDARHDIEGIAEHGGVRYRGTAYTFFAWKNSERKLKNPILLAEGFPGGNDPNDIYNYFNGYKGWWGWNHDAKLADALRERGYDVVILIFSTKGAPIQGNAYVYLGALDWIRDTRVNSAGEVAALGGSMGGLIARYALAYGETQGRNMGNVTKLMTFDSPHCGANVPLSVQATARYFDYRAKDSITLLNYACSKQMLVHQRWLLEGTENLTKPDFTQFYAELKGFGNGGYPSKPKKYALSNGSIDGTRLIAPDAFALKVWRSHSPGPKYDATLWCTPNAWLTNDFLFASCLIDDRERNFRLSYSVEKNQTFFTRDGCAGGYQRFFDQARESLNPFCANAGEDVRHRVSCFVPAYSSLGIEVDGDAYSFVPRNSANSPFDKWYAPAENQVHCTIDKASKEWVLELFGQA